MNILSKLWPFGRAANAITTSEDLRVFLDQGGGRTHAGITVTPDSAMRCAVVYACVRVIAESMAQLPLPVYRRLPSGGKERAADHPVATLLNRRPNAWQTAFEFREMLIGHLCLRGNAYAWINRAGPDRQPKELIPLRPDSVEVEQLPDYSLRYWWTPKGGIRLPLQQRDVLHLRGLSTDGVSGMSPITAYSESVGVAMATQQHQAKSFSNGARFRGYLKHKTKLSPEAAKRLREDFDRLHGGENAYATPLLEEDMDWVTAGMSDSDAQTIETRKLSRSEIASIFRVPPHMIGDLDRATFSNIEHQSIQFVANTLGPWCARIEQSCDRDLIGDDATGGEVFVEHVLDGLLRGDTLSRYQAHNLAINGGWKSRNEVRAIENMNPVDGLDEFLSPLNMRDASADPLMQPKKEDPNAQVEPAAADSPARR